MPRLWGRGSSINVQKVLWTLGEIGVPFEHIEVGGRFGGLHSSAFRALNPNQRIPVIEDGGVAIWESHAIVRYLCARYSPGQLWPVEPAARARSDQWMEWCATTLQPAFMGFFWGWYRTPEAERDATRNAASLAAANAAFTLFDEALAGDEFERPTLAGIVIGAQLYRYFTLEIDRPPLPRLEAWYGRLGERAAYSAGVMRSYDELKGRLSF
ncbi:MAG: glutathione S-transferase family protein [Caulobacteraceae bacterium]